MAMLLETRPETESPASSDRMEPIEDREPTAETASAAEMTATPITRLAGAARRRMHSAIARQTLWRNKAYVTLFGSKMVSETGSQMSQLAFPLLVLLITHSAAIAGLAGALRMLPYVVLTLPAGALVDRWDRRRVMLICDSGRLIALGSIPVALALGHLSVVQIFVVSLVEGTLFVFFDLAELAILPSLLSSPDEMTTAAAQYQGMSYSVSTLLGPALGGALFAAGRMLPFVVDAVSYGLSVLALARVKLPRCAREVAQRQQQGTQTWRTIQRDVVEGMVWLWRHSTLRSLAIFLALGNVLAAAEALLVIVLAERLHASAAEIGLVMALGGVGAVVGSLVAERVMRRLTFTQAFVGGNWAVALVWLLYAVAPTPLILGLVMACVALLFSVFNVAQFSYRMSHIPEELQGRVGSLLRLSAYGTIPLSLVLTGALIQHAGPVAATLILGVGLLALAGAVTLDPHIRHASAARTSQTEAQENNAIAVAP